MGVYIKGMEMPANCTLCACGNDETRYCKAANEYIPMIGKPRFCPLVAVAEPRGRCGRVRLLQRRPEEML